MHLISWVAWLLKFCLMWCEADSASCVLFYYCLFSPASWNRLSDLCKNNLCICYCPCSPHFCGLPNRELFTSHLQLRLAQRSFLGLYSNVVKISALSGYNFVTGVFFQSRRKWRNSFLLCTVVGSPKIPLHFQRGTARWLKSNIVVEDTDGSVKLGLLLNPSACSSHSF